MLTEEIKIDLTEIGEKKSRDSVKSMIKEEGIAFRELDDFWKQFENVDIESVENAIIFSDLHTLVKHARKMNPESWSFRVRKNNPYFISLIRNARDIKYSDLIDELVKLSNNRLSVINVTHSSNRAIQRKELMEELQNIVSRNFNSDSVKSVSVNKINNSFLIEFNDGMYGEITFKDLKLDDIVNNLLLDSVTISDKGNAIELFTKEGEVMDIDSYLLKSFISNSVKDEIKNQSQVTADNVGMLISTARKDKGITQKELSEITGIDQAIISKIETSKHLPRFDTLERIAAGLGMSVSELLNIT